MQKCRGRRALVHVFVLSGRDVVFTLGAAVLGGALIGFERQRRSRGAGLRTNTLVARRSLFTEADGMAPW